MLRTLHLLAQLLLVAAMAANSVAQPMGLPVKDAGHPAGCHGPMPATPSPAPTSHDCCASGHQSAIPASAFSLHPTVVEFSYANDCDLRAIVASHKCSTEHVTLSDSPPGAAPLLI